MTGFPSFDVVFLMCMLVVVVVTDGDMTNSPVGLGTQIFADYPQMLAYARSPPNTAGVHRWGKNVGLGGCS